MTKKKLEKYLVGANYHLLYLLHKLRSEHHLLGHRYLINDNF